MGLDSVLVIGRTGQLGWALAECLIRSDFDYVCLGRPDVDLVRPETIEDAISDVAPKLVINTAAFTDVDGAEGESALAEAINTGGAEALARVCVKNNLPLIHISTDYVFDGTASRPYRPDDPVAPIGAYGRSKEAGEEAVRRILPHHIIVRTAWLYDARGRNFLTTMLRLGKERERLTIVDDQTGAPTFANDLAGYLDRIASVVINHPKPSCFGTFHLTNAGSTTWFGFASEIFRIAGAFGYHAPDLVPVPSSGYRTAATRPAYSVLDCSSAGTVFGVYPRDWKEALRECMRKVFSEDGQPVEAD